MTGWHRLALVALVVTHVLAGCGDGATAPGADAAEVSGGLPDATTGTRGDAGTGSRDAAPGTTDAGSGAGDADAGTADARTGAPDATVPECSPGTPGPETHVVHFDEYADGAVISDHYASRGVVFESDSPAGALSISTQFASPVSAPSFLVGEYEGTTDVNPGSEFGNNEPALPITIRFVDPIDGTTPAVTSSVSLHQVYSNHDNVTRIEAFDVAGELVDADEVLVGIALPIPALAVSGPKIHTVVVIFNAPGSTGSFEDNAGIDDLEFLRPAAACP